ncbi:MAG: MBL fold metallo-hydrolase [Bacteroidetes bacterium]|nr:MAG: MBL fold metallo-hydrolase [Bacteroidota bacterium]
MQLHVIDTGFFKLDGGAMFGVVPQPIWKKLNPPDDRNLCTWAMRCLLIEDGDRLILIDSGLGDKQSDKFFSYYEPHGDATLENSLKNAGFSTDDITDHLLTHLHFDHCGGSIKRDGENFVPAFKNAKYWCGKDHWEWAVNPNSREKASFLKENILPIQESGQLNFIEDEGEVLPGIHAMMVNGHTEKMIIPHISYKGKTIVYMADLLPSVGHIPIPYIMAYDVRPLETLKEKTSFLNNALENDYVLFFEHDKDNECCSLKQTERGIRLDETIKLLEI